MQHYLASVVIELNLVYKRKVVYVYLLQGSSERSESSVRFNPNLRSEPVRYFSERETNLQAIKRLISL